MQISDNFVRGFMRGLCSFSAETYLSPDNGRVGDSNIVKAFITVPKDACFIPYIVHDILLYSNSAGLRTSPTESDVFRTKQEIVVPLYEGNTELHRTTDSILKTLLLPSRYGRLTKVVTTKGEVFYGGHGVVLKDDGTPILLVEVCHKYRSDGPSLPEDEGILSVSPEVFTMDNIVYKGIIGKIIPLCLGLCDYRPVKFRVCITDIHGFSKPQLVDRSMAKSCITASQFLRDHIENVFL